LQSGVPEATRRALSRQRSSRSLWYSRLQHWWRL